MLLNNCKNNNVYNSIEMNSIDSIEIIDTSFSNMLVTNDGSEKVWHIWL